MSARTRRTPSPPSQPYWSEIVVFEDGRVAFRHLSEDLLPLALELAPEDPVLIALARSRRP